MVNEKTQILSIKTILQIALGPFLLFGIPLILGKVLFWGAASLQFISWREYAWSLIREGILPWWNPLNGMGAPLAANYQTALFYPPGWIIFLFSEIGGASWTAWAFTLLVPVHLSFGGIGIARFLADLGVENKGQVVAGVSFALGGYFVARATFFSIIWAAVWLPWLVWSIYTLIHTQTHASRLKQFIFLIIVMTMQLLAGHAQLTWYSILYTGLLTLFLGWQKSGWRGLIQAASIFLVAGIISSATAMIQLGPTYEYLYQSQRAQAYSYDLAMQYSFWPWRLLSFIIPDLFGNPGLGNYWGYATYYEDAVYIGLIPILLAISTLIKNKEKSQEAAYPSKLINTLWVLSLLGLLLSLGKNTPIFPWLYKTIPTFDMFQAPTRFMIWTVFSLTILAGIAAGNWSRPSGKSRKLFKRGLVIFIGCIIAALGAKFIIPGIEESFIRGFIILGVSGSGATILGLVAPTQVGSPQMRKWQTAVYFWLTADLILAGMFLNPTVKSRLFEINFLSETDYLQSSQHAGRVFIPEKYEQIQKYDRFFNFEDTTNSQDWQELRKVMLPNLNLLEGFPSVNNFDPLVPGRYATWMNALSTANDQTRTQMLNTMNVNLIMEMSTPDTYDFQYQELEPQGKYRYFSCAKGTTRTLDQEILNQLITTYQAESTRPLCIMVEQLSNPVEIINLAVKIDVLEEKPGFNTIKFESTAPGWIRVADVWYPGWRVSEDGNEIEMYRVDYLFMGFPVSAGEHTYVIYYDGKIYRRSGLVSLFGCTVLLILWIISKKIRASQDNPSTKEIMT